MVTERFKKNKAPGDTSPASEARETRKRQRTPVGKRAKIEDGEQGRKIHIAVCSLPSFRIAATPI
jgi:hypothetical protein